MEKVLIWPEHYPLLLKGLIEQNGAFILDALEAWPACSTKIEDNVSTTVLPPIYYLVWLAPRDPFDECTFQHISDFDEQAHQYINAAREYFLNNEYTNEQISEFLLERLSQYADVNAQLALESPMSLAQLLFEQRYFSLLEQLLARGALLSSADIMLVWQEVDFRSKFSAFLPQCAADKGTVLDAAKAELVQGKDFFTLLQHLSTDDNLQHLLEQALLAHLQSEHAKQSLAMRFVEQGAKGSEYNEQGQSALMLAAEKGFVAVLEAILSDASMDAKDEQGNTALHYAVAADNSACLKLLLRAGANFHAKNNAGLSCYRYAVERNRKELVRLMEREFGIKELSPQGQYMRVAKVHVLHALVVMLLPLQLFFFFDESIEHKSELTIALTMFSMVAIFFAISLKRCALYPQLKHPFGLGVIRMGSVLSLVAQLGLLSVVALAFLSQLAG
ncbi:ankyrin repeat domain-containing protein [Pseudoalteromonas sp. CNC9-20]|uniref:ankyrin repeat domain-containing protein n=1 Tax=Pseudoalteromonas sp. CNC9-20 TaxID=2917750 RepID=UPI001EF57C17|nr:ankyrin repeat domain-containing protein [Pseudoalteromonas sp. CNC9-20]MCG7569463.1 ankyrin repeat domain-containing protein [Pseudoalteromonas sp. CNC9-20]